MKRRSFLLGSASVIAAYPIASLAQTLSFPNRVTCLVIAGVTPEAEIQHLLALFDVFTKRGLPFSCVVTPFHKSGQPMQPEDNLSTLIAGYTLQGHGLEFIPFVPELSKYSAYFQGRHVREASLALNRILTVVQGGQDGRYPIVTVACEELENPKSPTGVRSAGVNTVLTLPKAQQPVSSQKWQKGVVRLFGGRKIDLSSVTEDSLVSDTSANHDFLYLSAPDLKQLSVEEVSAQATKLAGLLLASERAGRSSLQLVSDLQLRDHYGFNRFVALHLSRPDGKHMQAASGYEAFVKDLGEHSIPVSVGDKRGLFGAKRKHDYWLPVPFHGSGTKLDLNLTEVTRSCLSGVVQLPKAPKQALPAGHSVAFGDAIQDVPGFDKCGVLWLPCIEIATARDADRFMARLGQTKDVVISILPKALELPFVRTRLLNQLLKLAADGVTRIVPTQLLGQMYAPEGAEIERQRRTVASLPNIRPRRQNVTDAHRKALLEDARIAWGYFEENTVRNTGLCPATVNFSESSPRVHPTVTMWDVGSHINALVAARQLDLVSAKRFDENISQILKQVRGRRSQDRLLPQGWLRVDREKWGNKNFDGSDAGRLLASFVNLRRTFGRREQLNELVESWDLDKIVVKGEVHSVTEGELHSVYRSHSAHYSARAFRSWGIRVASPYEVFHGRPNYDDQMALLETVSWIGPLGAEPLLLEAMELGMSKESAYLADVLFAAQVEEYEETGRFTAVSEGPIDREPWFTYQGLQMDAQRRTWALDTVGYEPKYANAKFWQNNLVVSSKAAFLWSAYRPHEYSSKLLDHVRGKARTKRGFASSIFSETGRVTSSYTDLNTNAVILQAIANTLVNTESESFSVD